MNVLAISAIVFGCVFGAALLGFWLRTVVPPEHLGSDSKDLIKLGMGAIATMSALVLGLLMASAKSSYDADGQGLAERSAKVVLLDRMLAHYGPQAQEARVLLKVVIADTIERIWPKADSHPPPLGPSGSRADVLYYEIEQLAPKSDAQRGLQTQVLALTTEIAQTRLLMIGHSYGSTAGPLLVVVVFVSRSRSPALVFSRLPTQPSW